MLESKNKHVRDTIILALYEKGYTYKQIAEELKERFSPNLHLVPASIGKLINRMGVKEVVEKRKELNKKQRELSAALLIEIERHRFTIVVQELLKAFEARKLTIDEITREQIASLVADSQEYLKLYHQTQNPKYLNAHSKITKELAELCLKARILDDQSTEKHDHGNLSALLEQLLKGPNKFDANE